MPSLFLIGNKTLAGIERTNGLEKLSIIDILILKEIKYTL